MKTNGADTGSGLTLDDLHTLDPAMAVCLERARVAAATEMPVLKTWSDGKGDLDTHTAPFVVPEAR